MKKIVTFFILTSMLLGIFILPQYQIQADSSSSIISIYIDGQKLTLDRAPVIDNNRTLVPLRGVFEKLGATVDWNKETSQAIIKNKSIEVLLEPNNQAVLVNGQVNFLDTSSRIQDERTLVPLRFITETLGHKVTWNAVGNRIDISTKMTVAPVMEDKLPTLDSSAAFAQLLHYNNVLDSYINRRYLAVDTNTAAPASEPAPTAKPTAESNVAQPVSPSKTSEDFSGTNNQTEGVDEGDIIKTNGKNIFSLNQNSVYIMNSDPIKPTILSTINVPTQRGNASDIYVENNRLVLIGTSYVMYGYPKDLIAPLGSDFAPTYSTSNTFVLVYDITNPAKPVLSKDMDYEGSYVSSRLIQDKLYVISSKALNYWGIMPIYRTIEPSVEIFSPSKMPSYGAPSNPTNLSDVEYKKQLEALYDYQFKPKYANNITGKITVVDYKNIHYFPNYITPNYMLTIGIDLASDAVDVKTYLGSAEIVYASENNLYLSFTKYEYAAQYNSLLYVPNYNKATVIYKFKLENGQINYEARGSAPGSALNQFSLDEFNGNLRIATTTGQMWDERDISKNNVYILNSKLQEVGKLTDLAPGERIYSTRFAGNRIYMVTFKQVDPFFVIDATNPTAPKVLGYLKVPGFSTYMHILDENHVLGFGTDTVEQDGRLTTGGFKISLFDVTNPAAPVEKSKEIIGVTGTYSELQNNHKALMISLDKGIMAFPITVAGKTPYATDFSGAYVYNITRDAFSFKGTVTHQPAESVPSNGDYKNYNYNYNINRLVYIGDYLYSLSQGKMEVTSLKDMTKSGEVAFPIKVYDNGGVLPIDAQPNLK